MFSKIVASAIKYGLIAGAFFSLNFLFVTSENSILFFLGNFVFIMSVVYIYRFTIRFREVENEGVLSYGNAFLYVLMMFIFGSFIAGAVVFVYCKINPAFLVEIYNSPAMQESLAMMQSIFKVPANEVQKSMDLLLSPGMYAFQYVLGNVFYGVLAGLLIALFVKKSKQTNV